MLRLCRRPNVTLRFLNFLSFAINLDFFSFPFMGCSIAGTYVNRFLIMTVAPMVRKRICTRRVCERPPRTSLWWPYHTTPTHMPPRGTYMPMHIPCLSTHVRAQHRR